MTIGARRASAPDARSAASQAQSPPPGFACPRCRGALTPSPADLHCPACGRSYPVIGGVATFVTDEGYWGEIPEEDMAWLVSEVERGRPWRQAILDADRRSIQVKAPFLLEARRASWAFDIALPESAQILDVGAGLGGVSAGLAPHAARVVALEPVDLRARFAAQRFIQDDLTQVQVVRGTVNELPFPPASFDLVVLNGVLEWLGKGSRDPGAAQRAALSRLAQVLRPEGTLVVAIENRIGIWFFLGRQDHSYLPYTSLLPRWLADRVTRALRGHPYDTYTYTHEGYRKLFTACGLPVTRTLLPIWGYNCPDYLVPLEPAPRADLAELLMAAGGRRARWPALRRLHAGLRLSRLLANDFIFFARRRPEADRGWLDRMVRERWASWGLPGAPDRLSFLIHNRSHPTIVVYAGGEKLSRLVIRVSPGAAPETRGADFSPPRAEIEALRWMAPRLEGQALLEGSVPRALDLLEHAGSEFGVTSYMPGLPPVLPAGEVNSAAVRRAAEATVTSALVWLESFHRVTTPGAAASLSGAELAAHLRSGLTAALEDGAALAGALESELASLPSLGQGVQVRQHGDFVLSNLRLDGERVGVIDWERFGRVPMPGFDAIHFVNYVALLLQTDAWKRPIDAAAAIDLLFDPGPLGKALRVPLGRYLAAGGLDPGLLEVLHPAYLAAFIVEYGGDPGRRGIVSSMAGLLRAALHRPGRRRTA